MPTMMRFASACQCDENATCVDPVISIDSSVNTADKAAAVVRLCVSVAEPKSVVGIDSLNLFQQGLVVSINATSVTAAALSCENDICMIQAPISADFFDEGNVTTVSYKGVALVTPHEEFAFEGNFSVFMEGSGAGGAKDPVISDKATGSGNASGVDDSQGKRSQRSLMAAWLVPMIALVGITALAVYFTQRSR
jgi:hypothetical protein